MLFDNYSVAVFSLVKNWHRTIKKRLSKIRVGLPKKVEFHYSKGVVECYPKEKKWVVCPNGELPITHFMTGRNDVTKYKARHLLKLALIKLIRNDAPWRKFYYSYTLLCAGLHGGLVWRNMCGCNAWLAHTFGMRHNWGGGLHITYQVYEQKKRLHGLNYETQ